MSVVLTHENLAHRMLIREMSRDIVYFVEHFMRDEMGARFHLKWFHVEMLRSCADEAKYPRLLLLEPAAHGKTTHVGKHYPLWTMCWQPRCAIVFGSKNQSDAEARLSAIKAEMEGNEELVETFGPFKGDIWRDDMINLAGHDPRVKDPSCVVIGSTSSIYGKRATHFLGDDMVTNLNSGPHVEESTRSKVSQEFHQGIAKINYPGRALVIRMVNTVVDQRDLVHELGDLNNHAQNDTVWDSSKRFHVIRRPALDEQKDPPEALWPEKLSVEELMQQKSEDLLSFLKRMQNLCLDPKMMNFQRMWFDGDPGNPDIPGCLDHNRSYREMPQREGVGFTIAGGYDPNPGTSESSKYCAYAEVAFDRKAPDPRTYWVTDLARFRETLPQQEAFCCDMVEHRNLAILHIEDNAANQWLLQLPRLVGLKLSGHRIEGFNTNVKTKFDPDTGVPAMAGMIRGGKYRFPYKTPRDREMTEWIIGEFLAYPQGATTDLIMALWFAFLAANKVVMSARQGVVERARPLSPFLANRGISAGAASSFVPTIRRVN